MTMSWRLSILLLLFLAFDAAVSEPPLTLWPPLGINDFEGSSLSSSYRDGTVRLVGGTNRSGNVEVLHFGEWRAICDDAWDVRDANVVCRQLGFAQALRATVASEFGVARSEHFWLDDVRSHTIRNNRKLY